MAILEGESLLNDAAGIVSFKIALAAIITGTFSFTNASREFFVAAIGGMFLGIILGLVTISLVFCLTLKNTYSKENHLITKELYR